MALSKIIDASISAGVDSAKIGAGDVSNAEHAYLNSVSSNVQTQISAAGGGPPRNFFLDPDFEVWPEGTSFTAPSNYCSALTRVNHNSDGVADVTRSTDVPTAAESGHQSVYSFKVDVTTADASIAATQYYELIHHITGNDYALLHGNEVTLSFWHKHTKTGIYCVAFQNGASGRGNPQEYTQTTTNTWEKATITLTLDTTTGSTWLYTEADVGLRLGFAVANGSTYSQTADTWTSGNAKSSGNQVNGLDSTSNNFAISQVQLELGSSASAFTKPPIATIKDQVAYYIERYDFTSNNAEVWQEGGVENTGQMRAIVRYREKRIAPTITSTAAGTFDGWDFSSDVNGNSIAFDAIHTRHARVKLGQAGTSWTVGQNSAISRDGSDTCNVTYDARH